MTMNNRRRRLVACVAVLSAVVSMSAPATALADSSGNIVTLGADLTDTQRETVLEFFNLTDDDLDNMEVVEVTNDDEQDLLSDYLSADVIGTQTLSCSYIQPTSSGGINVETANLTYVTKNTITNALETAGVENVNVVVTAPYAVSGTGALTGIFLAYDAIGETIDEDKQEAAVEEMVESAELEDEYGSDVADLISDVKDEAEDQDLSDDDILDLIDQYADEKGLSLSDDAMETIAGITERAQNVSSGGGFFSSIANFFTSIGTAISTWFTDLVDTITGNDDSDEDEDTDDQDADTDEDTDDESDQDTDEDTGDDDSIFGDLNTDIFDLDDPDAADGSDTDNDATGDDWESTDTGEATDDGTNDDADDDGTDATDGGGY